MQIISARRLGALTAGVASAALALGTVAPAAQAASSPSATLASGWLTGDLPAENYYSGSYTDPDSGQTFTYTDAGLTIDTGLAAVADKNAALVTRTQAGVAAIQGEYVSFGASATAKTLAFATRSGADPRAFGGTDLVALLESQVDPNGRLTGSANIIGQGFAAEGLSAAGSSKAAAVVSYLQGLQCPSGAFGFNLPATGAAASCTDTSANPGADNTSLVAVALAHVAPTASINATIDRAATFVLGTGQGGRYGGDATTAGYNSNSTGLAAALLGASCRVAAADQSADQVRALQLANGAVAYDQAAYTTAQTDGVTDDTRDQFRRSTNQATTGLVWDTSAPATVTLSGPAAAVAPGSAQSLTVAGAAKGETVCLTTPTGVIRLVGTGSPVTVPVTAPTTGTATYAATTGPGSAVATLTAARPAATVPVPVPVAAFAATTARSRAMAGGKVTVALTGLTAGEKVVVTLRGQVVKKTRAGGPSDEIRFRVPRSAKPGKAKVKIRAGGDVDTFTLRIKP